MSKKQFFYQDFSKQLSFLGYAVTALLVFLSISYSIITTFQLKNSLVSGLEISLKNKIHEHIIKGDFLGMQSAVQSIILESPKGLVIDLSLESPSGKFFLAHKSPRTLFDWNLANKQISENLPSPGLSPLKLQIAFRTVEFLILQFSKTFFMLLTLVAVFLYFFFSWKKKINSHVLILQNLEKEIDSLDVQKMDNYRPPIELHHTAIILKIIDLAKHYAIIKANDQKATLIKQVVHDIRSPVAALGMLLNSDDGLNQSESRSLALKCVDRINIIANSMLENIKKENNQTTVLDIVTVLQEVIREKVVQVRNQNKIKISLQTEVIFKHQIIPISAISLHRIISNLINNSCDAMDEKSASGQVTIKLQQHSNGIELSIKDNGKGIPENILHQVGVDGFTYGKNGGNGIGLASAIENIKMAGGKFSIDSKLGFGTNVSFFLPHLY
ncbi:MAG: HAMP domain-containing sensor histidine kinase [Bacteriovoracaceae bacterium]|nr:HAMP domain-containing sensor histidine kinase [Bacteriovoracaceae bacterium]